MVGINSTMAENMLKMALTPYRT